MTRRFEFTEDGSKKFWEIAVEGAAVTVRYGRIGTDGQTKAKDHGSPAVAAKEAAKLVAEKTKKGYVESASAVTPGPQTTVDAVADTPSLPTAASTAATASEVAAAPSGPTFPTIFTEGANIAVSWVAVRTSLRRRIDPDHETVVAALVRGWRVAVGSREEAEALLARVLALPGDAPKEPSAVLAWLGWDLEGGRTKWVVFGAILGARCSDSGPDDQLWLAKGPAAMSPAELQARVAWADGWIGEAFRPSFPETAAAPATYFVTGGAMGDGYLALGSTSSKASGLELARRTLDSNGRKHKEGIYGAQLAHVAWDEGACVEVDLSESGLEAARARLGSKIRDPQIVVAANYDSRS